MRFALLIPIVLLLTAPAAFAEERTTVVVKVDGKERRAIGWSLDGAPLPDRVGDLLYVEYQGLVVRDTDAQPRYRGSTGNLYRHEHADDWRPVLVTLRNKRSGKEPGGPPKLSEGELAGLRGVWIQDWSPAWRSFLDRLDATRVAFQVHPGALAVLSDLPARTRYLALSCDAPLDLASLSRFTDLRALVFWGCEGGTWDLRPLAALQELHVLQLPWGRLRHPDALADLPRLRSLSARCAQEFTDLAFVRGLGALRRLDVSHTDVEDLSPATGLFALESIDAHLTSVRTLPREPFPALRALRLGSTLVADREQAAFRRRNPTCELPPGRRLQLLEAVAEADRLRVRTGGMCCREPEDEILRCELTDPVEIRALLDLLRVDDCGGEMRCMCCGSPTFEFYAGDKLLVALSFHHDRALRWHGGPWPGDVAVAGPAQSRLFEWLRAHGETGPLDRIESARRRKIEAAKRTERLAKILGRDRLETLRNDLEDGGYGKHGEVMAKLEPDLEKRIRLAFRLMGAARDTYARASEGARAVLDEAPLEVVTRLGAGAFAAEEPGRGYAIWLLLHGGSGGLTDEQTDQVMPQAARLLLLDPDPQIRRRAIYGLGGIKRPYVVTWLRRVVEGVRFALDLETADAEAAETQRNVVTAAEALVRLGDRESIPRLRELAKDWTSRQRRGLERAIEGPDED